MHGTSIHDLYRQSRQAATWGFAVSLFLAVAKLAAGWFGHSVALLVDSVHSFGDALLSGVVWGALLWSQRPPDREHPYGHTLRRVRGGFEYLLVAGGVRGSGGLAELARSGRAGWGAANRHYPGGSRHELLPE